MSFVKTIQKLYVDIKYFRHYFGATSNPEETVFKRLKDSWNDVVESGIEYGDLDTFDSEKWEGTFLGVHAKEVTELLKSLRDKNTFSREDQKELLNLVLIWLGEDFDDSFRFQYPGSMSHARFLMQSIHLQIL